MGCGGGGCDGGEPEAILHGDIQAPFPKPISLMTTTVDDVIVYLSRELKLTADCHSKGIYVEGSLTRGNVSTFFRTVPSFSKDKHSDGLSCKGELGEESIQGKPLPEGYVQLWHDIADKVNAYFKK